MPSEGIVGYAANPGPGQLAECACVCHMTQRLGAVALRRRPTVPPVQRRYAHTRMLPPDTPSLSEFMATTAPPASGELLSPAPASKGRSFRVETYGFQMNVSDTQVVARNLVVAGYSEAPSSEDADIVFLNTCAIREKAESKIWGRMSKLRHENKPEANAPSGSLDAWPNGSRSGS